MKNKFLKKTLSLTWLVMLALAVSFSSCGEDPVVEDPILVEDGMYIVGDATALTELDAKGLMSVTKNEVLQENRAELMEMYIAVKATGGFNIVSVAGQTKMTYGPGADFAEVLEADLDVEEPKEGLWKGMYEESETQFTVPEDGLYHVIIDTELGKVAIARVKWGLIGGATPGGWGQSTEMTATFDLNAMDFVVDEVTMLENEYKFRYSNGWKIILDTELDLGEGKTGVKVNTNFGGSLTALEAGGDNIAQTAYAVYKYTLSWELGAAAMATEEFVKEGEVLPEYPLEMYMIGDGVGDWDWANTDLPMVAVHSHPELFWKIVWINDAGGFKFCEKKEWGLDFGVTGTATDGVYAKGGDNVAVPGTAGYYMVVVDLENETIEVNPAKVMFMGAGTATAWTGEEMQFDYSIEDAVATHVITNNTGSDGVRLYASASTLACDWWQAEFIVLDGVIQYRGTGGDQARVEKTAGTYTFTLNFKAQTGSIE